MEKTFLNQMCFHHPATLGHNFTNLRVLWTILGWKDEYLRKWHIFLAASKMDKPMSFSKVQGGGL